MPRLLTGLPGPLRRKGLSHDLRRTRHDRFRGVAGCRTVKRAARVTGGSAHRRRNVELTSATV
jgi:hypothetical protein